MSKEFEHIVIDTAVIPRLAAFTKAALAGVMVSDVAGDRRARRAWEAYARVGKELSCDE